MRPEINQIWEDKGSLYKITNYYPIGYKGIEEEMWNYKLLQPDGTLIDCDNLIKTEAEINEGFKFISNDEKSIFNINHMYNELRRNKNVFRNIVKIEKLADNEPVIFDKDLPIIDNKNVK